MCHILLLADILSLHDSCASYILTFSHCTGVTPVLLTVIPQTANVPSVVLDRLV
jgi:hypothetical protein